MHSSVMRVHGALCVCHPVSGRPNRFFFLPSLAQRSIRGVCVGRNFVEEKLKAPGGDEPLCVFSRSRRAKTRKKMNAAAVRRRVAYAVAFLCSSHSG